MKRFAAKLVFFVILVGGTLTVVSMMSRRVRARILEDRIFFLGKGISTLAIGDSHPQTSVDPGVWPEVMNLCEGQENYLFTYHKLVHFLGHNPQVTRAVLGFSYHNLAREYQELFLTGERESIRLLETYFVLLNEQSIEIIYRHSQQRKGYYLNLLKFRYGLPFQVYLDKDLLRVATGASLRRDDVRFFGSGFHNSDKSNVDDQQMDAKIRRYFLDKQGQYAGASSLMREFLERIIQLCQDRGVALYLYNAPLHPAFKRRIPEGAVGDFTKARDELLAKYPGVHYMDMVDVPLPTDYYGDGDHVNSRAAKVVSARLANQVR